MGLSFAWKRPFPANLKEPMQNPSATDQKAYRWSGAIVLLFALLVAAGEFLPDGDAPLGNILGVALLALAAPLAAWPFWLLRHNGRSAPDRPYYQTTALVERGVYALVRHPQYLAYMLLFTGFALLQQHWLAALLAAGGVLLLTRMTLAEETLCRQQFGAVYDAYSRRVPRLNLPLGIWRWLRRRSRG